MYENGTSYDQEYMEQEEEWEREGLLDPAWEKQQKKVSDDAADFFILQYFCERRTVRGSMNTVRCFVENRINAYIYNI